MVFDAGVSTLAKQPLTNRTLFFYGMADLPVMLAVLPMMLYMNKFYASDVGIDLADLATILLLARVFDLITDPWSATSVTAPARVGAGVNRGCWLHCRSS